MNLTKITRKEPLPSGVYVVRGQQGVGKTSFCTALLCADYRKWRKYRVEEGKSLAQAYYRDNKIKLEISDRLYFSNIKILLDKRKKLYTHYVDVQRLGLPNPDFKVQYLPRGSVVYIQEADILLFCRNYNELNEYLINLFKYVRHNLLTIILDCQVDSALDKAVRRLTVGVYHIERSFDGRFFLFWKVRRWKFIYIHNQLNDVVKELATVGVKINISVVERGRFRCFGNIFERYNSFSGVPYFLHGIENVGYEYLENPSESYSIKDINAFVQAHPLERPEDMKKKKGKEKNKGESPCLKPFLRSVK
ncbi:MAG: hypothetical protein IJ514_03020 [Clostridia bacterium]|nr:hypothetical protein [Clostridia bacterium]